MLRVLIPLCLLLAACSSAPDPVETPVVPAVALYPGETPRVRALVNKWADHYDLPRSLVHRVIQRESDYRPAARNGPYWGLMQILPATARNMGMQGTPSQLLEADKALKYSVRYLRGAWMVADGDEHEAMMWYARGYYYEAKRKGLLQETGLRGELWQRVDRGEAEIPPIDEAGNLLPPVPACTPATGLARVLGDDTCT
ncbi:lytic transglycosylase domain-containing protein [Jannaschia sp. M317]|uniref:lytic transglycosylase domain-containing protein n=1 Tax=Jannaschia sp. M317 TaxID=2867011 RepID=UPI0021FCEBD1|nr:lytic transglycosylase domain-containing protein [Jannaschia sp. M317]UWQ18259.1 lytic transglycosylase domain-containing protein [Jannaschia sp. M317]